MEPDDVGVAVVDVLRPTIAALTDEVLSSVVEAVPPFTEWWGGALDVRDGVDHGIRGFLELLEGGGGATGERLPNHDVFFAFGRSELRAGRSVGLERSEVPHASIITRVAQQLGGSFGVALLAVILQHAASDAGLADGFDRAFWWATGFGAVAAVVALLLPAREAA